MTTTRICFNSVAPHTATDIAKLEAVQCRSARWATRDYQRNSSVTQMLQVLNWRTLEQRRINSQLTLMYKITYDLVAIPKHRRRKLFNIGGGGGGQTQHGQIQYLGGGGVLPKVHIGMRAHAHVCTHMCLIFIHPCMHACTRKHTFTS